ncbi:MAG: hypothetical protein J6Y77_04465 [Paludibacteraceae bacterium]|nr:hypothetical protein [Paludibacteraceae bacterium]
MFKYLGSLLVGLVLAMTVSAQEAVQVTESEVVSDAKPEPVAEPAAEPKNPKAKVYQGTYLNLDIYNPIYTAVCGNRFEFEVSVDVGLWHRLFPKVEFGMQLVNEDPEIADYQSNGFFFRAGADFNLMNFQSTRKYDHSLCMGLRYGYAHTRYALASAEGGSDYWGESGTIDGEEEVCDAGWIEGVLSIRAEVCPHFLIGLAAHLKFMPHYYAERTSVPVYIPGYGKNSDATANFGLSLTLTYQIPY